jgi:serine/threonine-protein kinase HipA
VLSTSPDRKYEGSYFDIAVTLLLLPGCGEPAVHELLRRIEVNELLGNADMHLKNIGLLYPDGVTASLAPAYDITSTAVLVGSRGHALQLLPGARNNMTGLLSARTVKDLCDALPIGYPRANKIVRDTALAAARAWLQPIVDSGITPRQKAALIGHFVSSAHGAGVLRIKAHARLADDWQRALMAQRQLAGL